MAWKDSEAFVLKQLRDAGISMSGCVFACSMMFGRRLCLAEVEREYAAVCLRRPKKQKNKKSQPQTRAEKIAACLLHHADLIRAGHRPENTEYVIESDGIAIIRSASGSSDRSSCGSSAALCAEATA